MCGSYTRLSRRRRENRYRIRKSDLYGGVKRIGGKGEIGKERKSAT